MNAVATGMVSTMMPSINIPIGDWNFSISPAIAFGNASGIGASIGIGYSDRNWSFSAGVGIMSYGNYNGFGKNAFEVRKSILAAWDDGKMGASLGTNFWGGDFKQRTGMIGFRHGDFSMMYENDGGFGIKNLGLGDRGDSYRTAALNMSIGDFSVGFNLFTGRRSLLDQEEEKKKMLENSKGILYNPIVNEVDKYGRKFKYGFVNETGTKYRLGALSVGFGGYRIGTNSEHIRHAIQNRFIHNFIGDRGFENQSWNWKPYFQYRTFNRFTSW